jgi:hypothetical protein
MATGKFCWFLRAGGQSTGVGKRSRRIDRFTFGSDAVVLEARITGHAAGGKPLLVSAGSFSKPIFMQGSNVADVC